MTIDFQDVPIDSWFQYDGEPYRKVAGNISRHLTKYGKISCVIFLDETPVQYEPAASQTAAFRPDQQRAAL